MQCDYCDNKASVFFTQVIDGKSKKSSLCAKCATEQGLTDPEGLLLGHAQPVEKSTPNKTPEPILESISDDSACPDCGFSFDDLKQTGRLGCAGCYQFFREALMHNLGGMHKGIHHKGRVPLGMMENFEKRQQLKKLEKEMAEAISQENYETAGVLKDQIDQLSTSSPSSKTQFTQPDLLDS